MVGYTHVQYTNGRDCRERMNRMNIKKWVAPILVGLLAISIAGCGSNDSKEIKIGVTPGPHAIVAEEVAKEAQKQGINLKVVEFSDYKSPDAALADGSIQLNAYQHKPFLDNYNKQAGTDLVPIGKTLLMPMGIYSNKVHNLKDIPDGSTIAIPNDPTNEGRGLKLLEQAGLIKLKDGVGYKGLATDIISNPKHLKIESVDAAQLPRSLEDITAAAIPMNYVQSSGMNVQEQGLFLAPMDDPLSLIVLVARAQDKDNETYKKIADIYKSDAIKKFIDEKFNHTVLPAN